MTLCTLFNLALLCATAALACAPSAFAQNPNLAFKPGIWEVTTTVNKAAPKTVRACFAAGTNLDNYLMVTNRGINNTVCTVSNKVQKGRGITFDNACTNGALASQGHFDFQLPDDQNFTGTSHTVITGTAEGKPVNRTIDKQITAKFVAVDCGTVAALDLSPAKAAPAKTK
jgi:hypothetical protein